MKSAEISVLPPEGTLAKNAKDLRKHRLHTRAPRIQKVADV